MAGGKNAIENNGAAVVKGLEKGYESCMKIAACRNTLLQLGLNFGLTNAQIEEAMRVGQTRDINQIKELTPEQIAWLDAQIMANRGLAHLMFGNQTYGDRIYAESKDNNNNTLLEEASGAIAAGGAPGLPPDDDENKNSNKNNEKYQNQRQQERFDELNVSNSNTGARWTVDIKRNPQMIRLENGLRSIELKFR